MEIERLEWKLRQFADQLHLFFNGEQLGLIAETFRTDERRGCAKYIRLRCSPNRKPGMSVHPSNMGVRTMPTKSAAQQMAAGAALSAKRGETPKSKLKGASK